VPAGSLGRAADGSRDVANEMRSKTPAAPAPNKMHCQVAKVGLGKYFTRLHRPIGEHWLGTVVSCAVQKPTPTPIGTDATRRAFVRLPAEDKNRTTIATPAPNKAHCHNPNVRGGPDGKPGHGPPSGQYGNERSCAVQRPKPTPTGTDATRRTSARMRRITRC
jgi:hypothetical protein